MKTKLLFSILTIFWIIISGCGEKLPVNDDLGNNRFQLVDQNGKPVLFPDFVKGKISIIGYIFTNCPDICPLTTNNMRLIQEKIKEEKINDVEFVSISFDPDTDTPEVLRKFAEIRNLDLSNWAFLTGEKIIVDSLIKKVGVFAVPGDSTVLKSGKTIYYYVHTDRIQLIDKDGMTRKNYPGSKIDIDEIIADIKSLD